MDRIEKYFIAKADKLSYIELKNKKSDYRDLGIEDIPLPIIVDDLMDGISKQDFSNKLELKYIVDGMLYNLAIDKDFKYNSDYVTVLNKILKEPETYAVKRGMDFLSQNEDRALVFFRAAFILKDSYAYGAYNYARLLWRVALEEKSSFVEQSIRILERIIRYDESFVLAYYELGEINLALGDFIKADSFYRKSLQLAEDENVKNEIREKINSIFPDVAVANAIYYINRMDYNKSIEILLDARKNSLRYDIPYYIAVSYVNMEKSDMAEIYFEEAIEKGADFATLYVDYTYVKYVLGKDVEALRIADQALEKYPTDIKLRYNRAIINIELGKYDKANEDFDFILEYQDLSDELFNQIMIIKESMKNRGA
ncbi:tetratricopeptide repeat protein [Peptoniphilaceae bacterium SGI.131]